jgi:hypothetical protein
MARPNYSTFMDYKSYSGWYVGQKIICVDGLFPGVVWEWCSAVPISGDVYTIRAMKFSPNHVTGICCLAFYLEEISNPIPPHWERGFKHIRFRPLSATESTAAHYEAGEPNQVSPVLQES